MEKFTAAIRAVCFVSAGMCIIRSITDATKLRRQMDAIMKLLFAVVIITPFVTGDFRTDILDMSAFDRSSHSFSTDIYDKALAEQTAENVSDILTSQIEASGIKVIKIMTEVNISPDGGISINKVIIEAADFNAAADIIRSSLGQETEVINGNQQNQ